MFNLFNNKKRVIPPFNDLQNSTLKDKYFYRIARWDWLDNKNIHVFDPNAPRIITMDPWPQIVFLAANGQKMTHEFVSYLASQYSRNEQIPEELDKTILELIDDLLKEKLIELSDIKIDLPENIKRPRSVTK